MNNFFKKIIPKIGTQNAEKRNEWLIRQLQKLPPGLRILDAGAGTQQYKKYCLHLNYVSQDFASYIPNETEKGLQNKEWNYGQLDIISDITNIPEPGESFDIIMCTEVLEHLPYPSEAIKELSRLLKPGGKLIITAPFCSLTHQAPHFYSTGFSTFYYEKILSENGLEIEEIIPNGSFFEYMAQENRRMAYMANKYAGVSLSIFDKLLLFLNLKMLNKLSKKDKKSHEILCFEYFVRAKKLQSSEP